MGERAPDGSDAAEVTLSQVRYRLTRLVDMRLQGPLAPDEEAEFAGLALLERQLLRGDLSPDGPPPT